MDGHIIPYPHIHPLTPIQSLTLILSTHPTHYQCIFPSIYLFIITLYERMSQVLTQGGVEVKQTGKLRPSSPQRPTGLDIHPL